MKVTRVTISNSALSGFKGRSPESGAVLVVTLVILTVLTVLGVSAMQGSTLAGKISSNYRLEQLITQGAEAALLEGERLVATVDIKTLISDTCTNGYCSSRKSDANYVASIGASCANSAHLEERWALPNSCAGNLDVWNTSNRSIEYSSSNLTTNSQVKAHYIIEYMGLFPIVGTHVSYADCSASPAIPCPEMYRITALSSNLWDRGRIMLQTTYEK